jgi:hypothetical protein
MDDLRRIKSCFGLTPLHVSRAVDSGSAETKALLEHLASIARPNQGAPKLLLVFARMATSACEWLDGDLRVELVGDGDVTVFELLTELGGGLRERALPSFVVKVPLQEFVHAVERVPKMLEPLHVRVKSDRRIVLATAFDEKGRSLPPPAVEIADEHLEPDGPLERKT